VVLGVVVSLGVCSIVNAIHSVGSLSSLDSSDIGLGMDSSLSDDGATGSVSEGRLSPS
jgi:hypothetical protein